LGESRPNLSPPPLSLRPFTTPDIASRAIYPTWPPSPPSCRSCAQWACRARRPSASSCTSPPAHHVFSERVRRLISIIHDFPTILIQISRPQPCRLAHSTRLLPSPLRKIAAPTQRVQSLAPHKLPQSRAPLPYPRRITPQADRRETHPGCRRDISAGTLRA
jgi:hypothetical protein